MGQRNGSAGCFFCGQSMTSAQCRSEVTETESYSSCSQCSILSQGTVGCQEFFICPGVDLIILSISDSSLLHL